MSLKDGLNIGLQSSFKKTMNILKDVLPYNLAKMEDDFLLLSAFVLLGPEHLNCYFQCAFRKFCPSEEFTCLSVNKDLQKAV